MRYLCILTSLALASIAQGAGPVWKVSNARGQVAYLAGSMHALRSVDYPLPSQFNQAFEASSRLAMEVDPQQMNRMSKEIAKAGEYPKGDSLKNHVDPRTYAYLRKLFGLVRLPEEKFARYRPWMLALSLQSPGVRGLSGELGIEEFLTKRARANRKPIVGLESPREHANVYVGLSDVEAEAVLLIMFIPNVEATRGSEGLTAAWRRGDADFLWRVMHDSFRDYPAFGERILEARNRAWVPKIEGFIGSGQTYMVVVGAAHMGGPEGLLALMKARGYKVEQL